MSSCARRLTVGLLAVLTLALAACPIAPGPVAARPAAAAEPPSSAPVRLVLSSLGVDAPVTALDLAGDGTMPAPEQADLVAWYTFSAPAGRAGNAVLAGHRDWQGQRGVFSGLGRAKPGDDVWLQDTASQWSRYTVVWSERHPDDAAPLDALVGPTERPAVTLITCAGALDRVLGRYRERRVVRAELAPGVEIRSSNEVR